MMNVAAFNMLSEAVAFVLKWIDSVSKAICRKEQFKPFSNVMKEVIEFGELEDIKSGPTHAS